MTLDLVPLATVLGMALVTLGTRLGGAWMMSFVPMTRRLQVFLRHLASSVMVAVVVGAAARGDIAAWLAIIASTIVMVVLRNTFAAIVAGMATAAGWRALAAL